MNFLVDRYHRLNYVHVSCLSNHLTTMRVRNPFEVFSIVEGQTAIVIDSLQTEHYLKTFNFCFLVSFALELISV